MQGQPSRALRRQDDLGLQGAAKCLEQLLAVLQGADSTSSTFAGSALPQSLGASKEKGIESLSLNGYEEASPPNSGRSQLTIRVLAPQSMQPAQLMHSSAQEVQEAIRAVQEELARQQRQASPLPDCPIPTSGTCANRDLKLPTSSNPRTLRIDSIEEVQEEMLQTPVFARTSSTILKSPADSMDRSTRLLALIQQREDELNKLKTERSAEVTRLSTLLQKREDEITELKAKRLIENAHELTREQSQQSWAAEAEQLRADMAELTARHAQELQKARGLLQRCEEDLARANTQHGDDVNQLLELLKERETELADLKSQGLMKSDKKLSTLELDDLHQSMLELQNENLSLKSEIHTKRWCLERLEVQAEKDMDDSLQFIRRLASSSAGPKLNDLFDMRNQELLGMGNYGYVMTCLTKKSGERIVVKLQGERWVGLAQTEWAHGSEVGIHPNIVTHIEAIMHGDVDGAIRKRLADAFDKGILTGKRPKFFPQTYFCLAIEYMDRGTLQNFIDKELLTVECMGAVAHQIASALAFMHKKKRTHNDIKPENILLCAGPSGDCLVAKLADLGLADHSLDQRRDHGLFAYTVWCTGLHRQFERCPSTEDDRTAACERFLKAKPSSKSDQRLWKALHEAIRGMWLDPAFAARRVEEMEVLQKLKIKVPDGEEAAAELEVCAKRDIGRRQTKQLDKWKMQRGRINTATSADDDDINGGSEDFSGFATI